MNYTEEQKENIIGLIAEYAQFPVTHKTIQSFAKDKGLINSLEVGKWYKCNDALVYLNTEFKEGVIGYGFLGGMTEWTDKWHAYEWHKKAFISATNEEVQQALIAEAKRRGFKEGVTVESVYDKKYSGVINSKRFSLDDSGLWAYSGFYDLQLFENGKWATFIEEPKSNELTIKDLEKLTGLTNIKIVD